MQDNEESAKRVPGRKPPMRNDGFAKLLRTLARLEEAKQNTYLKIAENTTRDELRKLLGSLSETKGRHARMFSPLLEKENATEPESAKPHFIALQERASSLLRTLTEKAGATSDFVPKLLVMESCYRTEEESVRLHKSVRQWLSGIAGICFDTVIMEEERDLVVLRRKVLVAVFGITPD